MLQTRVLTEIVMATEIPEDKAMFITSDNNVICKGTEQLMSQCDHEEADTRIIVHVKDSLERGDRCVMVRTVDTDVVVILIGQFYDLRTESEC